MRVVLFTGKGGVGKTTSAAATAVRAAGDGQRTLVLSTDPAHSLGDALDTLLGPEPTPVAPRLYGLQIDTQRRFEQSWDQIRGYLTTILTQGGLDGVTADELVVLPGAQEVLALLEVREQAMSGDYDVIVVDCAPTAETLRLLALPEALRWYFDRLYPTHRRLARSVRPLLARGAIPDDDVFGAVERLHEQLAAVQALLTDPATTSVRLVLTPESVVLAEARRTFTSLALYGFAVDGVIANRLIPGGGDDPWRNAWVSRAGRAARRGPAQLRWPAPAHRAVPGGRAGRAGGARRAGRRDVRRRRPVRGRPRRAGVDRDRRRHRRVPAEPDVAPGRTR